MKKTGIMMITAALIAGGASAADVTATADFASAYIFRGVTLNDGLVFQPGASISGLPIPEEYGSVVLGTWANFDMDDYGGNVEKNDFSEVDYYATYILPVKLVDLSTTYTEYTYPIDGDPLTDREVAVTVGKAIGETGLYPSISFNYGLDGYIEEDWYILSGVDYTLALTEKLSLLSALKAGYKVDNDGQDGFQDGVGKVGLKYAFTENWFATSSLNYVAQLDDEILPDGEFAYDKEFFATAGVGCSF